MDIAVHQQASDNRPTWTVTSGTLAIQFSDEVSAIAFAEKLKERVEAPHPLLGEVPLSAYAGLGEA